MSASITRRHFVAGTAGAVAGFSFLGKLPELSAEEVKLKAGIVPLNPDIEPLVRKIEDTPRDKLIESIVGDIHSGTTYQQILSALMLAGMRGIKPRPVGFQFHAVLVVNAAHLASLAANDKDRWLPLLWSLDNFKVSQATNKQKNDGWMMPALDDSQLPSADRRRTALFRRWIPGTSKRPIGRSPPWRARQRHGDHGALLALRLPGFPRHWAQGNLRS